MRKLASIQKIETIEPIPKADAIERAKILGWWVVVKKGQFQVGDRIVYCEIDSLLPERQDFEFLRKSCFRAAIMGGDNQVIQRAGFRIRTVCLRGQVSQGICFPLDILPAGSPTDIGTDVTDLLGIIKYDPPVPSCLSGKVKGMFPTLFPKTDEIRAQVLEGVIARHTGKQFGFTEKLDGSSCTVFVLGDQAGVCGRTLWFDESIKGNTMCDVAMEMGLFDKLRALQAKTGKWHALQGEIVGPGIQGNRYALPKARLFFFNILEISEDQGYRYLNREELAAVAAELEIECVPQLDTITLNHTVDQLVELSRGPSIVNPKVPREGIVLRPLVEENDHEMGRLSFKVINPDFLLKYEE